MELEVPSVESDASLSRADTMSDNEEVNQSGVDGNIRTIFSNLFKKLCTTYLYSTLTNLSMTYYQCNENLDF